MVGGLHSLLIWDLETKSVLWDVTSCHKVGIFQVMTSGEFLLTRDLWLEPGERGWPRSVMSLLRTKC